MRLTFAAILLILALTFRPAPSANAADPAAAPVFDPAAALAGLPREVVQDLRPGSRNLTDAAAKASQIVAKNVEGKTATVKIDIFSIEKFQRPTPSISTATASKHKPRTSALPAAPSLSKS